MEERSAGARWLWNVAGAVVVLAVGSYFSWDNYIFWRPDEGSGPAGYDAWFFMFVVTVAYGGAIGISERIVRLPKCGRMTGTLLAVAAAFTALILFLFVARTYYSRSFVLCALGATTVWAYAGLLMFFSSAQVLYGFVPGADIRELRDAWRSNFFMIPSPSYTGKLDILVVPSYWEKPLSREWSRFIANMTIQGVPMAHPGTVYEFFTGRMPIEYMTEGLGVVFKPPQWYPMLKRAIDWVLWIVFAIPAVLLCVLIAVAALCTSGRPIFFSQRRTGKNGRPFTMYKFRTLTDAGEPTPLGRYLRKFRLDELPQFINVAKGEMSFIGPRPEVPDLVRQYSDEIAFYSYRNSMLPGITGWAQVNYGYASVTSQNKVKLGYDLYYIKYASLALDVLILIRTVRIMVMGYGK